MPFAHDHWLMCTVSVNHQWICFLDERQQCFGWICRLVKQEWKQQEDALQACGNCSCCMPREWPWCRGFQVPCCSDWSTAGTPGKALSVLSGKSLKHLWKRFLDVDEQLCQHHSSDEPMRTLPMLSRIIQWWLACSFGKPTVWIQVNWSHLFLISSSCK